MEDQKHLLSSPGDGTPCNRAVVEHCDRTTPGRVGRGLGVFAALVTLFSAGVALGAWSQMPGHEASAPPSWSEVVGLEMQKAKKYDWKDSNLALFGSDTEKKVKKESAESEPAWKGAGQETGLQIWRINKFKVENWDKEMYGSFYSGDSYIVLNTYKTEDGNLMYDLHFWIGKYSTQDEYGTAAYKTVELDTFLDDKPVQHREVQGHESSLFKSYFSDLTLLKGGADTGFRQVIPAEYRLRLFEVKKVGRKAVSTEIAPKRGNLNSDSVFIIDTGAVVYQYNGDKCSHDLKFKAASEVARMKDSRGKIRTEVLEERSTSPEHPALMGLTSGESSKKGPPQGERKMFCVSDADGSLDMDEIASGDDVSKDKLTSNDAYIINTGTHVFVWMGKGASVDERKKALPYASNYLNGSKTPFLPISVVVEGNEDEEFLKAF